VLGALLLAASAAAAQDILGEVGLPKEAPNDAVLDLGGMLDVASRRAIEELSIRYRAGSEHEVRLVTVPGLAGRPIEDVAREIGRTWKMGSKETSDGAVLLGAGDEHELRIETGRGLEGVLPDVVCARIIRDVIVPRLKAGDVGGGLLAGMQALHAAAGGDYGELPVAGPTDHTLAPLLALVVILIIVSFLVRLGRRGTRGRRGGPRIFPFPGGFGGGMPGGFGGFGGGLGGFGGGFGGFGGGGFGGGFGGGGGGGGFSGGGASGKW
jgi:uncharacterized protein